MKPYRLTALSVEAAAALSAFSHQTRDAQLRIRAQMVMLSAQQQRTVAEIAIIVQESESTVLRWLKNYAAQGLPGLHNQSRSGRPRKASTTYVDLLFTIVRQRPRSLGLPFSLWTLDHLTAYLNQQTGESLSRYTIWRLLREAGIVFSRPQHTVTSPDPAYQVKKRRLKAAVTS